MKGGTAANSASIEAATRNLVWAMTGREIGLASRWMIVPSSISERSPRCPRSGPISGSMVPMAKVCMSVTVVRSSVTPTQPQQEGQADQHQRQQEQQPDPPAAEQAREVIPAMTPFMVSRSC